MYSIHKSVNCDSCVPLSVCFLVIYKKCSKKSDNTRTADHTFTKLGNPSSLFTLATASANQRRFCGIQFGGYFSAVNYTFAGVLYAYGMEISAEKTKLMTNNTSGINTEIKVNGQRQA